MTEIDDQEYRPIHPAPLYLPYPVLLIPLLLDLLSSRPRIPDPPCAPALPMFHASCWHSHSRSRNTCPLPLSLLNGHLPSSLGLISFILTETERDRFKKSIHVPSDGLYSMIQLHLLLITKSNSFPFSTPVPEDCPRTIYNLGFFWCGGTVKNPTSHLLPFPPSSYKHLHH